MRPSFLFLILPLLWMPAAVIPATASNAPRPLVKFEGSAFGVSFDSDTGQIISLEQSNDPNRLDFLGESTASEHAPRLGDLYLRFRTASTRKAPVTWTYASTPGLAGARRISWDPEHKSFTAIYHCPAQDKSDHASIDVTERVSLAAGSLLWSITIANLNDAAAELGGLGLALPFNDRFTRERDPKATYTKHVLRHGTVAQDNSYFFWMRADGVGQRLLMTPLPGTHLEYFTQADGVPGGSAAPLVVYVHALAEARDIEPRGNWRLPLSEAILRPSGTSGDRITYSFKFQWADDDQDVRKRLVDEGLLDIVVAPGLVIPTNLTGLASVGGSTLESVEPEYAAETSIRGLASPLAGRTLLQFRFRHLGENAVTLQWRGGKRTRLEYFVTEPLQTLIRKRAAFLVDHQQVRDSSKWYDGVFSLWDLEEHKLRTPDDTGGLDPYMVGGSDDPDLSKAPYIAAKNLVYPDQKEIASIEYYLQHFVWGKLQRTDKEEPDPYGVYGVPNWKELRESSRGLGSGGFGQERMWRAYDYPHLIQLYFAMYQIAKLYPKYVSYLDAAGYLERAYGTARAYFEVPYSIKMADYFGFPGYNEWAYKLGIYHEHYIVPLIEALKRDNRLQEAAWLTKQWEKKVLYFSYDAQYPFGSEMFFDTTAFQSAYYLTRYGMTHDLHAESDSWVDKNTGHQYSYQTIDKGRFQQSMEQGILANMAARGTTEPTYYQLGSDFRGGRTKGYLTYMSQMGGLAILDYGLNYAPQPDSYVRIGYSSFLSSWALMNTGSAETDGGYWYPGKSNDGAASWEFAARKYGSTVFGTYIQQGRGPWRYDGEIDNGFSEAVAGATTIVAQDRLFGLLAYGGEVELNGGCYLIHSHDGAQQRVSVRDKQKLDLSLNRDAFSDDVPVRVAEDRSEIAFRLERRSSDFHETVLTISGLPKGQYSVGNEVIAVSGREPMQISIIVPESGDVDVLVRRRS